MKDISQIKEFFNNIGVSSSIMAGFSFTALIELLNWKPLIHPNLLKNTIYLFLIFSFLSFLMPLLLNAMFLNVSIQNEKLLKKLKKVQLYYTIFLGIGIGGLLGALCLFILGSFKGSISYLFITTIIIFITLIAIIMRWFKVSLKRENE